MDLHTYTCMVAPELKWSCQFVRNIHVPMIRSNHILHGSPATQENRKVYHQNKGKYESYNLSSRFDRNKKRFVLKKRNEDPHQ